MTSTHSEERVHAPAHLSCTSGSDKQLLRDLYAQHRNSLLERFPIEFLHAPDDGR